ncbi:class F sortase [Agreia pratensis]|uniref:class F sortase n=1 Tax=Agreia TaxID=110934 RepID=UPI000A2AADFF|nr:MULTISPECIES: class F sortase [Agreia]MBF4635191.1 class F sortase [Agreia pratensis]SMQ70779.1 Sortase family protein [Agreia sp. VKM Ac-1783]
MPRTDAALGAHPAEPVVQPARVQVPSLGIDVAVSPEGVDAKGALALSDDPAIASWYRYGPTPWSASGTSVIAAHVDSFDYGVGQFALLKDAPSGTEVVTTSVDGQTARFSVESVSMVDKTGVDWAAVFDRAGAHRLALITCGGEFNYSTGHYLSNVIVYAVPIA